jgi:hypothetical protein
MKSKIISAFLFHAALLLHADNSIVDPGVVSEVVSVSIDAKSLPEAITQFVDQASATAKHVRNIKISIDCTIKKRAIKLKLDNADVIYILRQIAISNAAVLELDESGYGFIIRGVVETSADSIKKFHLSPKIVSDLKFDLKSKKSIGERLFELGIHVDILEIDESERNIKISGSQIDLKKMEIMLSSLSLINFSSVYNKK